MDPEELKPVRKPYIVLTLTILYQLMIPVFQKLQEVQQYQNRQRTMRTEDRT